MEHVLEGEPSRESVVGFVVVVSLVARILEDIEPLGAQCSSSFATECIGVVRGVVCPVLSGNVPNITFIIDNVVVLVDVPGFVVKELAQLVHPLGVVLQIVLSFAHPSNRRQSNK